MMRVRSGLAVALAVSALVAGCTVFESQKVDYKGAGKLPPLEVPPDLTRPGRDDRYAVPDINPSGSATYSQYSAERQGLRPSSASDVLPTSEKIRVARDGDTRYLVAQAPPEKLWLVLREFWQESGFMLKVEMPDAGVMETDWAENRAKIPQDWLRNLLGRILDQVYSSGERDKFRTRLERSPDGGTEIYISHRGMVEQLVTRSGSAAPDFDTIWQPRPADPELEAEFLRRLMVKIGADETRAKSELAAASGKREERAKLVAATDGLSLLNVSEPFDRAWRRVGLALDRVGFTVEDRDRSKGVYFVRYADPQAGARKNEGFLDKLAFWRSDEPVKAAQYQVMVKGGADETQVHVLNKDGGSDATGTSKKILSLLYDQLK